MNWMKWNTGFISDFAWHLTQQCQIVFFLNLPEIPDTSYTDPALPVCLPIYSIAQTNSFSIIRIGTSFLRETLYESRRHAYPA
jgi:hypothetical protein